MSKHLEPEAGTLLSASGRGTLDYGDGLLHEVIVTHYRRAYGRQEFWAVPVTGSGGGWKREGSIEFSTEPKK